MNRKIGIFVFFFMVLGVLVAPVYAQAGVQAGGDNGHWMVIGMAIAAAGCGYAQSKALTGGCEGVSRNPGATDTIRFFIILGLAFIEFLALLTFVAIFIV